MAFNTSYWENPADGITTFQRIRVERAPDAAGAPGAFVEIASIAIDEFDEFTAYVDSGGENTSWYRARYANTAGTSFSDYTDARQVGSNKVKDRLKKNIPDADLTDPFWDQWIDQALIDLMAEGIWKHADYTITPTKTGSVVNTTYGIQGNIRDVFELWALTTDGTRIVRMDAGEWVQKGREITIFAATDQRKYEVHGRRKFAVIGELTEDFEQIAYYLVRAAYFEYRENGRGNYRAYIVLDRASDISPEQLRQFKLDSIAAANKRIAALSWGEPAIPVTDSPYAVP